MNQTQVNDFLMCLSRIDDINYLSLHNQIQRNNNQLYLADHYFFDKNNANEKEHDHDHDHDHEHDHDHDHNLLIAKVTAMVVLFIASAICGSIPFLLNIFFKFTETHANARSATVVKCLLYFGGGVLLSTTFLHLLPEVQETVAQLQECGHIGELTFALAELLMCSGFFLMYLIEETLHSYIHRNKKILHDDTAAAAFERGHSLRNSFLLRKGNEGNSIKDDTKITSAPLTYSNESQRNDVSVISLEKEPDNLRYETNKHSHGHGHSHLPNAAISTDDPHMITSSLRGFFIVLALSIHELFEGMAIGLEGSSSTVWLMFGAVSAHKLVLAFCVGVELIVAKTRTSLAVAYVFLFAVVSPMGIGIGILISKNHETDSPNITAVVLQGLACGTLLYVVFFEILSKNHGGLLAYFSLLVGFLVMFGMQQLGATGHGHSHDGCDPHEHSKNIGHNDSAGYNFEKKLQQLRHAAKIILPTKNNHDS